MVCQRPPFVRQGSSARCLVDVTPRRSCRGYDGKVIRPGKEQYDRPIVDVWDPHAAVSTAEVVDLGQAQELRIVEPLASVDVTTAGAK